MGDILFFEIAAVIITAGLIALFARLFRQPLIIAYIITGLLVGPGLLGIAESNEIFNVLSEIGIAFLLFLVGLHLNWHNIKDVGKISVLAGLGQMIFTSVAGWMIASWLGFDSLTAAFIGVAFAFSSTIIVVKMLSDKRDLGRFYGRISVGILIVQDIVAMVLLLGLGAMRSGDVGGLATIAGLSLLKMAIVLLILWLIARHALPYIFRYSASSPELLFLIAVSWCFGLASGLSFFGFGIETGALLAGISLAGSGFQREIESKIKPLRDFFLIIFFIVLGTQLTADAFFNSWYQSVILSLFVLIGNPLIIILVLRLFGYHPRTGFLVGVSLAQVSEFSFILLASAAATGLLSESILPITTMVAVVTIAISSYFLQYNEEMFDKMEIFFRWMEGVPKNGDSRQNKKAPEILLFGYHNIGRTILPAVETLGKDYLVIDFDPEMIDDLEAGAAPYHYGDIGSADMLAFIKAERAKLIISTVPDIGANEDLLKYLKKKKSRATIILTDQIGANATKLYEMGATFVIVPGVLSGQMFAQLLQKSKVSKGRWAIQAKKQKKLLAFK